MEFERFKLYWLVTRRLALTVLLLAGLMFFGALTFSGWLDEFHLFGFPLGVLVAGQVVVVVAIAAMFWFIGAQDRIDTGFGANEDL